MPDLARSSAIDRKPGRPRSERARQAVLAAAGELLVEGGMAAVTMEAVAARAGVSKVTVYKWWPSRGAVAIDAYFEHFRQTITFADTGDGQLRADLDLEAFMDQLYAPLYFRLIIRHQPLDARLPRTLIRQALDGARP